MTSPSIITTSAIVDANGMPVLPALPTLPTPQSSIGFSTSAKGWLQPEVKLYFATPEETEARGPEMLKAIYEALMQSGLPIARPQ